MVIPPSIGNPYSGYKPYYWLDDHLLLYGNTGSLNPSRYDVISMDKIQGIDLGRWKLLHWWIHRICSLKSKRPTGAGPVLSTDGWHLYVCVSICICMYICAYLRIHIPSVFKKLLTYKPLESRKIKQGSPDQKIIHKQGKNWWRFHYSQVAKLSASLVDKKTPERQSREKPCKYFWDTPTLFTVEPENNDLLKAAPIEFFRILMMRRRRRMNGWRIKQNINSIKKILGGDQKKVSKKNIARTKSSGTWEGRWKPLRHGGSKNITRDPRTRPT